MNIIKTCLAGVGIAALAACGGNEAEDNTMVVENLTAENLVLENDMNAMDMNATDTNTAGTTNTTY